MMRLKCGRLSTRRSISRQYQFSCSVMSNSFQLQHARLPTSGAYSNSCPLSCWCHLTILSSVVSCSSCLLSFPASGSFPKNRLFVSGGQSIGDFSCSIEHLWTVPVGGLPLLRTRQDLGGEVTCFPSLPFLVPLSWIFAPVWFTVYLSQEKQGDFVHWLHH